MNSDSCGSPLALELLLHVYAKPVPFPHPDTATRRAYLEHLEKSGLIERGTDHAEGSGWKNTPRGRAFVQMLCNLKFPQAVWADTQGNIIDVKF